MAPRVKDAQGHAIAPDALYVCIESFSGMEDRCARGTRLNGSNELVQRHGDLFVADGVPDDTIHSLRARLWEPAGGVQ